MKKFDIIIAGGGMAGATAALALSHLQLKIAVIEPIEPALNISPSFDQRAVALSASSVAIFKTLELWDKIKPLACAINDIHISDQGHFGFTRIHAKDYDVEALGQVIPLDQTGPILWQAIREKDNIELFCPSKISEITPVDLQIKNNEITTSISDENNTTKLSAKLLLAADGTFSSIAKMAGIETQRDSYNQHAVIANISTELPHHNQAFERFTKHGPLALLPLTRNRMSLVWCQKKTDLKKVMSLNDEKFIKQLQSEFGFRLGQITKVGERYEYPLALHLPEKNHSGRVLLLGNSAHTLHPIAGQGFNVGLRDIAALCDAIQGARQKKQDIGCEQFLETYTSQRQADWHQTIIATDSLVRIFTSEFPPLVLARNKALCLLDKMPFVKQKLANAAMGYSGNSAKLTRGISITP